MSKRYFGAGGVIRWKQYRSKGESLSVMRTGIVWAEAPRFAGIGGAHVWVIPDAKYPGENSAIAVRVHRSGIYQGTAEVFEDSAAYTQYSIKGAHGMHWPRSC